jgi:hypothetical protein
MRVCGAVIQNTTKTLCIARSRQAQLVLINLPNPHARTVPEEYMNYCEVLVKDLRRVLFVHGTGRETWKSSST